MEKKTGGHQKKLRFILVLVILGAIGGGIWFWQSNRYRVSDNELLLYGNVDIRQVELAFDDSERIADLLVEEGDVKTLKIWVSVMKNRHLQEKLAATAGVTDAVIQGDGVRLVLAPQTTPAVEKLLPGVDGAELQAVVPRFEDGFVAMLAMGYVQKIVDNYNVQWAAQTTRAGNL